MKLILDNLEDNLNNDTSSNDLSDAESNLNLNADLEQKLLDSDGDGIPDEWEINGYTVFQGRIVPWDESRHKTIGLKKYVSDPFDAYSSGGPYTDLEKVLGRIDGLEEAKHPLVATYPVIKVEMDKMILSKNITVSDQQGQTASQEKAKTFGISTSNSHTDSTTIGASVTATVHVSLLNSGASASVSANFSNQNSNTVTTNKNASTSSNQSLGASVVHSLSLNQSETAFLNANIRYINIGTIPIYNLKPTINFVLGVANSADTIATISAKENTVAKVVFPEQKYPAKEQNAVAWNTSADFDSQLIRLNYQQVMDLANWKPLQVQITQIEGQYSKYNSNNQKYSSAAARWEYIMADIYQKTALIIIGFQDGQTFERRVAAVPADQVDNKDYQFPRITVKEAIEIAFGKAEILNNEIHYKDKVLRKNDLKIVVDEMTNNILEKQKKANIFDVILTKEMKIMFLENNQNQITIYERKIRDKVWNLNSNSYDDYFDLQNDISFDTDLGPNGEVLAQEIKKNLLTMNIPLSFLETMKIEWTYGIGQTGNHSSLREDHWHLRDKSSWSKTVNFKFSDDEKVDKKKIYFKNFFLNNINDVQVMLDQVVTLLKKCSSRDSAINLNNLIHFQTDLGNNGQYLKEIMKAYLLFKGIIPASVLESIDIVFPFPKRTLAEDDFNENNKDTWFTTTKIKYYNEWESDSFRIYFSKIRKINNFDDGFVEGAENFFQNLLEVYSNNSITRWEIIARKFNF